MTTDSLSSRRAAKLVVGIGAAIGASLMVAWLIAYCDSRSEPIPGTTIQDRSVDDVLQVGTRAPTDPSRALFPTAPGPLTTDEATLHVSDRNGNALSDCRIVPVSKATRCLPASALRAPLGITDVEGSAQVRVGGLDAVGVYRPGFLPGSVSGLEPGGVYTVTLSESSRVVFLCQDPAGRPLSEVRIRVAARFTEFVGDLVTDSGQTVPGPWPRISVSQRITGGDGMVVFDDIAPGETFVFLQHEDSVPVSGLPRENFITVPGEYTVVFSPIYAALAVIKGDEVLSGKLACERVAGPGGSPSVKRNALRLETVKDQLRSRFDGGALAIVVAGGPKGGAPHLPVGSGAP